VGVALAALAQVRGHVRVHEVVHGRVCVFVCVQVCVYGVHVVPDANANAVAPVYDLVNADLTVDAAAAAP
jgi:hypothetical protein